MFNNNDNISMLPRDLQMLVVSFLSFPNTLILTRCSKKLNAVFNAERVWPLLIERMSLNLLTLPMNSLTSLKERLMAVLNINWRGRINYDKLHLHYILKVNDKEHVDTLSTEGHVQGHTIDFWSDQNFDFKSPHDQVPSASLIVYLIYEGKTALFPKKMKFCAKI